MNSKEALNELFEVAGCERCGWLVECEELTDKHHCVLCEQWHNIIKQDLDRLEKLEKENQELKASYESLKKDYWELDKVEEDILQKFFVQG